MHDLFLSLIANSLKIKQPYAIYSFLSGPRGDDNESWEDIASCPGGCLDIWQGQVRSKFSCRSELFKVNVHLNMNGN